MQNTYPCFLKWCDYHSFQDDTLKWLGASFSVVQYVVCHWLVVCHAVRQLSSRKTNPRLPWLDNQRHEIQDGIDMVTSIQQERTMLIYAVEQRSHVSFDSFVHSPTKALKKTCLVTFTTKLTNQRRWLLHKHILYKDFRVASCIRSIQIACFPVFHQALQWRHTPLRTGVSQVTNHGTNIKLVWQVKGGEDWWTSGEKLKRQEDDSAWD